LLPLVSDAPICAKSANVTGGKKSVKCRSFISLSTNQVFVRWPRKLEIRKLQETCSNLKLFSWDVVASCGEEKEI
jgi:hypothetical protein